VGSLDGRISRLEGRIPQPKSTEAEARRQWFIEILDRYAACISQNQEVKDEMARLQEQGMPYSEALIKAKNIVVARHPDGGPELVAAIKQLGRRPPFA
jgi:hypothetical protein